MLLEIEGLEPADRFSVKHGLDAADGTSLRSEIIGAIHKLGPEVKLVAR